MSIRNNPPQSGIFSKPLGPTNVGSVAMIAVPGYILENGEIKLHGPANSLANDPKVREAYLGT